MKPITRLGIIFIALFCAASSSMAKGKGRKPPPPPEKKKETVDISAIKPFDKDRNFEIDLKEFPELQAAFKANPAGKLKEFDKGGDGVLDDTVDRAAINMKLAAAKKADAKDDSGPKKKKKK